MLGSSLRKLSPGFIRLTIPICFASLELFGQETLRPRTYTIADGMPSGARAIDQDSLGFIWVQGSELARFDGFRFHPVVADLCGPDQPVGKSNLSDWGVRCIKIVKS